MNRSQKIKESLLLLLVISIGAHATQTDDNYTQPSITVNSVVDVATEDGTTGTTRLPYEEGATITEISSESETTVDAILAEETVVYNRFVTPPSQYEQYTTQDEDPDESEDHAIPYSEHEEPNEVPTRPNYTGPGSWAKPAKDKNIPLEFVPTKLYAQVRGTHTVKRVPQEEARKSAQSDEEKENAPRLREVVTNSKVNTVYTEEGYEDSAYDHAGHIRDADFHEGYARKLHEQADARKKANVPEQNDKDKKERKISPKKQKEFEDYDDDYSEHYESTTPRMELSKLPQSQRAVDAVNPKLVTENGIEELERDLQKEVLAVENSVEFNKVRSIEDQSNQSSHKKDRQAPRESPHEGPSLEKTRSREESSRKSSSQGPHKRPKVHATINSDVPKENADAVTNGKAKYDARRLEESPYTDTSIFDVPTTIDYGQVFWDFFKSKDPESTTQIQLKEPLTTFDSNSETLLPVDIIGSQELYSLSKEAQFLTTPSAVEFKTTQLKDSQPIPNDPQSSASHAAVPNSDYISFPPHSVQQGQPNSWRPLTPSEALVANSASSSTFNHKQPATATHTSESGNLSSTKIEGPPEDDSGTRTKFRPRYKMLVRHKPKKGNPNGRPKQGPFSSTSGRKVQSPRTLNSNHKHAKVLNYIRNGNTVNSVDSPAHMTAYKHKYRNTLDDANKLRPVHSQDLHGAPLDVGQPTITLESESLAEANWQAPLGQQYPGFDEFNRQAAIYQAPFPIIEPIILTQQRASFPSTKLLPPAPLTGSDYVKYQPTNFAPHFRSVAYDGTVFGRKRRSADEFLSSSVKAVEPVKTGTSNLGEIEQRSRKSSPAVRNAGTERNSWRKAVDTQMGREFVLDTSGAKKFRVHMKGNEGKKLSVKSLPKRSRELIIDRESTMTNGGKNVGTSGSVEEIVKSQLARAQSLSNNPGREKSIPVPEKLASLHAEIVKRDVSKQSPKKRKTDDELLNESPRITEEVIDKELNARFSDEDETNESEEDQNGKVEVEIPDFDYVEELVEDDQIETISEPITTVAPLDSKKYPFYKDDRISSSALKYAVDPRQLPRKTAGGMEFYKSRDKYKECSEVDPSLDEVVPEEEEPQSDRGLKENVPRLGGLGDKLDCFKAKYFDENPFDNPLFSEKEIEEPSPPTELDPKAFASRIMVLPEENEDYVVQKSSRKPESQYPPPRNSNFPQAIKVSSNQAPSQFDVNKERERNTHHNRMKTRNRLKETNIKETPLTVVEPPRLYPRRLRVSGRRPTFSIIEKPISNTIKTQETRNQVFPITKQEKVYSNVQSRQKPFRLVQNMMTTN